MSKLAYQLPACGRSLKATGEKEGEEDEGDWQARTDAEDGLHSIHHALASQVVLPCPRGPARTCQSPVGTLSQALWPCVPAREGGRAGAARASNRMRLSVPTWRQHAVC